MAHYFGFEPVEQPGSYFISYNSEDADRVAPIAKELHDRGVPVWYDRGLTSGELWERQLADHIESCEAVILFITKKLLQRKIERNKVPYVRLEYNLATVTYNKTVYIAILDDIDHRDVIKDHQLWWQQILLWQCVQKATADRIIREIGFGETTPPAKPLSAGELNQIGYDYDFGINGKPQDYAMAVKYYRLSAEKGYAAAQNNLGYCYDIGNGVPQDYKEAVRLFRLAADQGDALAQNNLGYCYDNGQGVPQDDKEAVRLYRLAADQGHATAQYNLGVCYQNGQGVTKDLDEAIRLYRLAAKGGSKTAKTNLARLGVSE